VATSPTDECHLPVLRCLRLGVPALSHGHLCLLTPGAPWLRGEGDAGHEAHRKLAPNTLPGPVDAHPLTSYAVHNAIGEYDAIEDVDTPRASMTS
jgi:hypothetical protein